MTQIVNFLVPFSGTSMENKQFSLLKRKKCRK
jgi:hypothetical protein